MPIGLILAIIVGIALRETGTLARFGWAAVVFITPGFLYGLYRLWDKRDKLVEHADIATDSFRAIKVMRAVNKAKKETEKKRK